MSTLIANVLSSYNKESCYFADLVEGPSKGWVTVNIAAGVPTINNSFSVSSIQDLGVGLYKGVSSVALPGSNGSRAVGIAHASALTVTAFYYQCAVYDGTVGSSGIRMGISTESNPLYVHGVIF